jgi:hypothetical protein
VENNVTNAVDPSGQIEIYADGATNSPMKPSLIYELYNASRAVAPNDKVYFRGTESLLPAKGEFAAIYGNIFIAALRAHFTQLKMGKTEPVYMFGYSRGGIAILLGAEEIEDFNNKLKSGDKTYIEHLKKYLTATVGKKDGMPSVTPKEIDQLIKTAATTPIEIRYIGLVDPCRTATGGLISGVTLRPVSTNVKEVRVYSKTGNAGTGLDAISDAATPTFKVKIEDMQKTMFSDEPFPLTHVEMGRRQVVMDAILESASRAGAKFRKPKQ